MLLKQIVHKYRRIFYIYIANLFLSFHFYLVIYINSSFLESYFGRDGLGIVFSIAAIITCLLFLESPRLLKHMGGKKFVLLFTFLEFFAVLGMSFSPSAYLAGFLFIIHQVAVTLIALGLDIFLEAETNVESYTGELRGGYLTLGNLALIFCPLIVGILSKPDSFSHIYTLSALLCIPLFLLVLKTLRIDGEHYEKISVEETIVEIEAKKDIRRVTSAQLALQLFYAWMVVYMPLYLTNVLGFTWQELGAMFSIMLLPFVLFELPVGWLADKKFGEKEFMIAGFLIVTLCVTLVPFINNKSFVFWTALLFLSRTGASFAEISTETYIFKHLKKSNANLVSAFRMMRPLSYIIAPIIATFFLSFTDFKYIFLVLAVVVATLAVFPALRIKDSA